MVLMYLIAGMRLDIYKVANKVHSAANVAM